MCHRLMDGWVGEYEEAVVDTLLYTEHLMTSGGGRNVVSTSLRLNIDNICGMAGWLVCRLGHGGCGSVK
jgi:hypothetical protein